MSLNSILVILAMIGLFILAIIWISKQGGWQSGGCNGNCGSCMSGCSSHPKQDKPEE